MKSTSLKSALICMSSVLAVAALAQQEPGSTPPSTGTGSEMGKGMTHQAHGWRASKAIGVDVKTAQGERLGKVSDFIINPSNGRVDFAVLDWNNKLVPVPFTLLTPQTTPGRTGLFAPTGPEYSFTANVDTTKLQNAPTIDKSRWTEIQQPDWRQKVYSYYGVQEGMGAPGMGTEKGSGMGTEKHEGTGTETQPDTGKSGTSPQ